MRPAVCACVYVLVILCWSAAKPWRVRKGRQGAALAALHHPCDSFAVEKTSTHCPGVRQHRKFGVVLKDDVVWGEKGASLSQRSGQRCL